MNTCSSTWKTVEKTCTLPLYHTGDHVDGWFSWPNTAHRCHVGCPHEPRSGSNPVTGHANDD